MLKLLSANLENIGAVRRAFAGHGAFNVHPTTHHSEQDPFPDQLKGMWFCLNQKFFKPHETDESAPLMMYKDKVPPSLIDVYDKGQTKVKQNFHEKLFNTFHVFTESKSGDDEQIDEIDEELMDEIDEELMDEIVAECP